MPFIAIVGAGAVGGALAHKLAARGRVREVRLIDSAGSVARGKALDILQSSPIEGFSTRVTAAETWEAAAGAQAIVFADSAQGDAEFEGEDGLALARRIAAADGSAPLVFAGAAQRLLMIRCISELHVPARRVVGSAPAALESAVRALTALELDSTGVEVHLRVVGVPPRAALVAWEEATAFGLPVATQVAPHRLAAISARLPGLWPPGPVALAASAARTAEAIANGSRRRLTCFVSLETPRGAVAAMPIELGPQGVVSVLLPALTRQERTRLENGLAIS
jgi:malate dehydrogenase